MTRMTGGLVNFVLRLMLIAVTLAVWEALVRLLDVPAFILPTPSSIFTALYRGIASALYLNHIGITLAETLIGFVVGTVLAFALGIAVALSRSIEYFLYPFIVMFQAMPKVALAPLIIVWFGLGLTSKVVNAALVAFFPLMVNTIVGLRSAEEEKVDLMRSLAASRWQVFWMLRLPNAMPYIFAGLEIAMIFALIGAIVAEFVGAQSGLGMLIQSMNFTMDVAGQFSVLLILSVLGLILNGMVNGVRRRVLFWDVSQKALAALLAATGAQAETTLRVGFCARTVSAAAAPFAIAAKMGWFTQAGFRVELVPFPGSTDCVKSVATRDVDYALPSIEPLAIIRPQGVKAKNYYTAYQGNVYGIAVPADSAVKRFEDLKGKRVGVISMSSAGVIIARALAANHGMDPDRDISIVVAGEAAQTAALLRSGEVDALSQFDTQYALVENAGVKMRPLDNSEIAKFPSNGFIAFEATLKSKRAEAVALAQGYAKGTVFAIANPAAAVRALWEVFPQTKATGKDEATALKDDVKVLEARARNWRLEAGGVTKWGENSEANYAAYVDFLLKWGVLKQKVEASDIITNELIEDINKFDPAEITDLARKQAAN